MRSLRFRRDSGILLIVAAGLSVQGLFWSVRAMGQQSLPDGALLWYDFEQDGQFAKNLGGLGAAYDGTRVGDAVVELVDEARALKLDGDGDYVIPMGAPDVFNLGDADFTLFAKFQTSSSSSEEGERGLIWKERTGEGAGTPGITLGIVKANGTPRLGLFHNDGDSISMPGSLAANDGEWHSVLAYRRQASLRLFLDGILVGSRKIISLGSTDNDNSLVVGGRSISVAGETGRDDFEGLIDEVRIYDFAVEPFPEIALYCDQEVWCGEFPAGNVARAIGFDELAAGTQLDDQYPGSKFEPFNGGQPTVLDVLGHSGPNAITTKPCCSGGGGFRISFDPAVASFGFWINDLQYRGSFIELFDEELRLIARLDLGDVQGGSASFPFEWKFLGFASSEIKFGRAQVAIHIDDHITIDDFRYSIEGGAPEEGLFRRGDANADGSVDISDPVFILQYLFSGGAEPPCLEAADANDDNYLVPPDVSDPIYCLLWLFSGGPPIKDPVSCGIDPSPCGLGLGCNSYPPCENG